jgi:peptidoglycan pentaglycine glycine transferase (the first glycine)
MTTNDAQITLATRLRPLTHRDSAKPFDFRVSDEESDRDWDAFLQATPHGHFQQSSIWVGVKRHEGWRPLRIVVRQGDLIRGGVQLLVRSTRFGAMAYVSKGPVVDRDDEGLMNLLIQATQGLAKLRGIRGIVLQLPDFAGHFDPLLLQQGFALNAVAKLITATCCIDVGNPGWEELISRSTRKHIRQASKRGVVIREGCESELPLFFELMCATCRRQNTRPAPATPEALAQLWRPFAERGLGRLTFAECEGQVTAGLLSMRFGQRMTQWKKGWNDLHGDKHPNAMLAHEGAVWARSVGATLVDFVGMEPQIARAVLSQEIQTEDQLASRYAFILRMGGKPQLLPQPRVYWVNPLLRLVYGRLAPWARRYRKMDA